MRKQSKRNVAFTDEVGKMPPCSHWPNKPEEFDITKSEVVAWLVQQPTVMQRVFDLAREIGAIRFDEETELWSGINFSSET